MKVGMWYRGRLPSLLPPRRALDALKSRPPICPWFPPPFPRAHQVSPLLPKVDADVEPVRGIDGLLQPSCDRVAGTS